MFLQDTQTNSLVKIQNIDDLFNPLESNIKGCIQRGQEEQPPEEFPKNQLIFPSGESLPKCWLDPNYEHNT